MIKIGTISAIDSAGAVSAHPGASLEVGSIYTKNCGYAVQIHPDERLFQIADLIENSAIANKEQAQLALHILGGHGEGDKVSAYHSLVASMADHITVLAPFLPYLMALAGIAAS